MDELKNEDLKEVSESKSLDQQVDQIQEDYNEDDFDSDNILTNVKYDVPDVADKFVDTKDGTVVDKDKLTPFQIIKSIAQQNGHKIKEPNKGCHHCYGRGYESFESETQMPVPCRCLFRGRTQEEKDNEQLWDSSKLNGKMNHDQRRRMTKLLAKNFKIQRKILKNKLKNGENINSEKEEPTNALINKVLKKYIKLQSIKKTAKELSMTLTSVDKIISSNRDKIEKLRK